MEPLNIPNLRCLPCFEQWLENEWDGYKGNDVLITEDSPLLAWFYENGIRLDNLVEPPLDSERIQLPVGTYKVENHDSRFIILSSEGNDNGYRYLIKRYDFEEVKERIKV